MTSIADIANLIASNTELKAYYETSRDAINARVLAKEQEVDDFLANAKPETRYVQDIFIAGSADYLYPVWWTFPAGENGVSKITICRSYAWNGEDGARPLNPESNQQAGLLVELEGVAKPWGNDVRFMEIKRYGYTYNQTASNIHHKLWSYAEPVDPALEFDTPGPGYICNARSGVYLRGGGLQYRIIKNWVGNVSFHPGTDQDPRNVYQYATNTYSKRWLAAPIPVEEADWPVADSSAFTI